MSVSYTHLDVYKRQVLDVSIAETNNIAKLVPSTPGMNIAKAFSKFDKLSPEDKILAQEMKDILANPEDGRFEVLSLSLIHI